jgi:hypothetical protein
MTDNGKFRLLAAAALLAAALAGCTAPGASSDESIGLFMVAPDKFILYGCNELSLRAKAIVDREKELERLMAKAGDGADGRFVSNLSYRPEYLQLRGEMVQLRAAVVDKNCKFVPGVDTLGGRASEGAIR